MILLHYQPNTPQPLEERERSLTASSAMVFPSVPPYLDPSNWQQQHPNHQGGNSGGGTRLQPHLPPAPPPGRLHGGGTSSTIRPGSMAERARLANIPMPEGPLKCPRCESTNTKFCYFNNYSFSQPRYFCKICRRYWTRGGALRNVPVGGGCRKNKRKSKGSSSKSTAGGSGRAAGGNGSGGSVERLSSGVSSGSGLGSTSTSEMLGLRESQIPPLRPMHPLQYLTTTDFGSEDQIGLNYSGNPPPLGEAADLNLPAANIVLEGGSGGSTLLSSGGLRLPQVQQFPFFGGSDPYPNFEGSIESLGLVSQVRPKTPTLGVKMEHNNPEHNLSRQFQGIIQANDNQFSTWNMSSPWTDLSGFSSSSASNPP